ncbi:MAG: helix-turn-helix domain-containing protein, partial [Pseudonocardiaceae bacterium]
MTQQTFGGELRRLREQRGLSLKKFAHLVHYDPGYLSKIENGLKPPTATLAARCDAELDADGALSALVPAPPARKSRSVGHEIRIPVVIDGQPMLLPVGVNGELSGRVDGNRHRAAPTDFCGTLSRGLPGSSAAMIVSSGGMTWQWELPGGRSFGGATFPVHLVEGSWSTQHAVVIADQRLRSLNEFVGSAPRGVIIAETPDGSGASPVLLDAVSARTQIGNRVVAMPQAFQADDLTLGILWALSNLDEALLNDDANLTKARRCLHSAALDNAVISKDALTELSTISSMWLGSDSCARFIMSSTRDFSTQPAFWTREQRGEEASTWLFFRHKLAYLRATSQRFTDASGSAGRTFCIPEHAVLDSL